MLFRVFAWLILAGSLTAAPLTITTPSNDALITSARITVRGTAEATSRNIAVVVNDVAANVDLEKRDIDGALEFVSESRREKYRPPLTLIRPTLPQYAADTRRILPVEIGGDTAHYLLTRVQNGETHGYHVYFARTSNGLWKIVQF